MKKIALLLVIISLLAIFIPSLAFAEEVNPEIENNSLIPEKYRTFSPSQNTADASVRYHDTFMQAYFDGLTNNFGMNYRGSCGYVAIAMLLSYYDTFINDTFIPEQYDEASDGYETNMVLRNNSPGIKQDIILPPIDMVNTHYDYVLNYLSLEEYIDILEQMSSTYYHAWLLTKAVSLNFCDFSDTESPFSLSNYRLIFMLAYALVYSGFTDESLSVDYFFSEDGSVRDYAIEKISSGTPVILSVSNNSNGHALIAYDYDASTDSLYCNFGWNEETTHSTPESEGYFNYQAAISINTDLPHSHTNNYCVKEYVSPHTLSYYYCYDDPDIITYNYHETHSYTAYYRTENPMYHRAYCICGEYELQNHYVPPNPRPPYYRTCVICGGYAVTRPPIMEYSLSLPALPDEVPSCHSAK